MTQPMGMAIPSMGMSLAPHVEIEFSNVRFGNRINGSGPVYAGTLATNEAVAIKELTGPEAVEACMRVCGRNMMLHHPNIVRVRGMSEDGRGRAFVITELAPGGSLADALNSHTERNDWATVVNWALDVAYGLRYLHSLTPPLLHLNLKPQNVLLFEDGTAKLCDFGFAPRELQRSSHYAAPEVFEDMPNVSCSQATDIYGFGGVLFAMITNSEPWVGLSVFQICGRLAAGTPPSLPSRLPAQCPDKLAAIVRRCLQIDPRQRCPLSEVIEDLEQVLRVRDELATRDAPRTTIREFERGPLPPPEPRNVALPSRLLELLNQFERCPAPPGRTDILAFQNPTREAIRAKLIHVCNFIRRSDFTSDRAHEDAVAVGLYTDESFVYWLTNAWANEAPAERERYVGPFMDRLIEALPRCCPHYIGQAVRVVKCGPGTPQAMQNAFADYQRQYAQGTLHHYNSFMSFTKGDRPLQGFLSGSSIALFCEAITARDVNAYSMIRLARGNNEREVLCPPPSEFLVSHPPSKTEQIVNVCVDMQAAPPQ